MYKGCPKGPMLRLAHSEHGLEIPEHCCIVLEGSEDEWEGRSYQTRPRLEKYGRETR